MLAITRTQENIIKERKKQQNCDFTFQCLPCISTRKPLHNIFEDSWQYRSPSHFHEISVPLTSVRKIMNFDWIRNPCNHSNYWTRTGSAILEFQREGSHVCDRSKSNYFPSRNNRLVVMRELFHQWKRVYVREMEVVFINYGNPLQLSVVKAVMLSFR